jgi:hypothetical protein
MASGVFGLKKVYKKQVENVDNSNLVSWPENAEHGYYGGGYNPGNTPPVSHFVHKLDFSTGSVQRLSGTLPQISQRLSGIRASSFGYFVGGLPSTAGNVVTRLDYSTDSISLPGKNIPDATSIHGTAESNSYGYVGGGSVPGTGRVCTIVRIDLTNESVSLPGTGIPSALQLIEAFSNKSYGYFVGGSNPTPEYVCTVSRLDFSNDSISLPGTGMPEAAGNIRSIASENHAFLTCGTSITNVVKRFDFSNETFKLPGKNMIVTKLRPRITSDGLTGYIGTGWSPAGGGVTDTFETIDFTTEDVSSSSITLPQGFSYIGSFDGGASSGRSNGYKDVGYFMGGYDGGNSSYVKRMDFTSDTSSIPSMRTSFAITGMMGVANNNFGYAMGGFHGQGSNPPPDASHRESRLHRIDFATENLAVLPGTPQANTTFTTLWSIDDIYGWKAGDQFNAPPSPAGSRSDIRRLDYSTESWNVPGQIQPSRQSKGLVFSDIKNRNGISISGSGWTPTVNYNPTTFIKYQSDNDTITGTPFPALGGNKNSGSSIYNPQYGYYAGGGSSPGPITAESDVYRFDYSSDTFSDTTANTHANRNGTGVSSNYYGYFCQGGPASPPPFSIATITKFDYSTETVSPAPDMNGGGDNQLGSMPNGI